MAELRGHLLSDKFDGQIVVAAGVKDRRVVGIEVMRYSKTDPTLSVGRNQGFTNPENSSLPVLIYGFPRDWRPTSIQFGVAFLGEDLPRRA